MNESRLERRLRFSLSCSTIAWKKARPDRFASVTADNGKHLITLPTGYDDEYTLRGLIHELCHVAIPGELGAFGSFEEDILERVLEPHMIEYLLRHPRKHAWWLKELRKARGRGRA